MPQPSTNRPFIHALVYGFPGTKKSTFAATFPLPIYVAHFDAYGKDSPFLRIGTTTEEDESPLGVPIRRVLDDRGRVMVELRYYHDPDPEKPDSWAYFLREQKEFVPRDWGTWVLDSVTSAMLAAKYQQQFKINPNVSQPMLWLAGATDQLEMQLMRRAAGFACNVVVCCHIAEKYITVPGGKGAPERKIDKRVEYEETEEGHTIILRGLSAPGRLARDKGLISQYAESYRAYISRDKDGKKVWLLQTDSDEEWIAASQLPAPNPCAPSYDALFANT
jgi:hypothetical protein